MKTLLRPNVLLVDDQPGKLLTYETVLRDLDATLVKANSARDAFDHLLRTDFAVVLIDVIMPDLDGFELAAMIREHPRFKRTAIIFVSGIALSDLDRLRGYESGAVDYVPVPVVPEILRAKVRVFLELYQATRSLELLNEDLERRVEARTAELEEAARRKDEFLAVLAHELRNPLAAIQQAAQLLCLSDLSPEQHRTAGNVVQRQVGQLARMIDDLVDVSRITRGLISLRREVTDLRIVIAAAVESSRPHFDSRNHSIIVLQPEAPLMVDGDPSRLGQVVANVLHNAAKFTKPGGHITLTAALEGGGAVVRVRDNGIGVPPELIPRMFDLFTQFDTPLDRSTSGLGIGLALVKKLMDMHGGEAIASSDGPNTGTEITLRLPAILIQAATNGDGQHQQNHPLRRSRILVVDDNDDAAQTLAMMLRIGGHEVATASDGLEALGVAETFAPEVVLLDLGMPNLNGYETAIRMRAQPWGRSLPLIALTGWGQPKDRQQTAAAGFVAHLVKPVNHEELVHTLEGVLRP